MGDWWQQQAECLRALRGQTVVAWSGVEMAVREVGPDGLPQWHDAAVPALQLDRLDLTLAYGPVASVTTYQNDDTWGLYRRDGLPPLSPLGSEPDCIFRVRRLNELPPGEITAAEVEVDVAGDIAAVRLTVGGREVSLRAGEVYEQPDGSLRVVPMDECVLVQVDGQMPNQSLQPTGGA